MADPTTDATKNLGVLSSLEKSTELRAFLLMFVFFVFADCGLVFINGFGVCEFAFGHKEIGRNNAAQLLIIFMVFSFFMSVFMPVLLLFTLLSIDYAIHLVRSSLYEIWRARRTHDEIRRKEDEDTWKIRANIINELSSGHVRLGDIKKRSDRGEENYIKIYKEETEKEEIDTDSMKICLYALSAFCACLLNIFLYVRQGSITLAGYALSTGGENGLAALVLVLILLMGFSYTFNERAEDRRYKRRIYCPALAKEIEDETRRKWDMERKFEEDMHRTTKRSNNEDPEMEL